jgi:hypothetical protein
MNTQFVLLSSKFINISAFIYAVIYGALNVGKTDLTLAMASGDDDIPFYVDYSLNHSKYSGDIFANTIMSYSWSSWIRFLPVYLVEYLRMSPVFIHVAIVILQNGLILLGVYYLAISLKSSREIAFFTMVTFSLSRIYQTNLSWSGDLQWMPFATWFALGIGIFAIACNYNNYYKSCAFLIFFMSFTQASMAVSCLILVLLFSQGKLSIQLRIKRNFFYLSTLAPFFIVSLMKNEEEFFSSSYITMMKKYTAHWNAWKFEGQTFITSVYFFIFLVCVCVLLLTSHKYIQQVKSIFTAILVGTLIHILFYLSSYIDGMRLNLTRVTIFTTVILYILFIKFIFDTKTDGKFGVFGYGSIFLLLFFQSVLVYPIIVFLYLIQLKKYSYKLNVTTMIFFILTCVSILILINKPLYNFLNELINILKPLQMLTDISPIGIVFVLLFLVFAYIRITSSLQIIFLLFCFVILTISSNYGNLKNFQQRQYATMNVAEVQIWARENTPLNSRFILENITPWASWRNNSLRAVVQQDMLFHPYSNTEINTNYNQKIKFFKNSVGVTRQENTYSYYQHFSRSFGGDYLVVSKNDIIGKYPSESVVFTNKEFIVVSLK